MCNFRVKYIRTIGGERSNYDTVGGSEPEDEDEDEKYNYDSGESSSGNKDRYFARFSSAVPSQLIPSIWQAFHEALARVAARISAITSLLRPSIDP